MNPIFCLLILLTAIPSHAQLTTSAVPGVEQQGEEDSQERWLRAIEASKMRMGAMEPWKGPIFDEEVPGQSFRFITHDGSVDLGKIRQYLTFHGTQLFHGKRPEMLVYFKAEEGCRKCESSATELRDYMTVAATRRGFDPVWVGEDEIGDTSLTWKELDDRIYELARLRSAAAMWAVQSRKTPVENIDTAHHREKAYELRSRMTIRARNELNSEEESHLSLGDSFTDKLSFLAGNTYMRFGNRIIAATEPAMEPRDEVLLVFPGLGDYQRYSAIRKQLEAKLTDVGTLQERVLSRDKIIFALQTRQSAERVKRVLAGTPLEGGIAIITKVDGSALNIQVQ